MRIAPLSFAFETFTASERMTYLMNHELVHVVTVDRPARGTGCSAGCFAARWRRSPTTRSRLPYLYLTAPRRATPRWYARRHRGVPRHLDGRRPRPRAGPVRRDGVPLDDARRQPLLRSARTLVGADEDRLPGRSELVSLRHAVHELPGLPLPARVADPVDVADRRVEGVLRLGVQAGLWRCRSSRRGATGSLSSSQFQRKNIATIRAPSADPVRGRVARGAGVALARLRRRRAPADLRRPELSRHRSPMWRPSPSTTARIEAPPRHQAAAYLYGDVAGLRSAARTLFYTVDNNAYRDIVALDLDTHRQRTLLKDARIGDLAFDRSDRSLWGIRALNGICTLVRIRRPTLSGTPSTRGPYGETVYDLDVSPDGRLAVGLGRRDQRPADAARDGPRALLAGDPTPVKQFDFGTAIPSNFVFSPDGRYLFGSSYYTGVSNIFRYELATGELEAMTNAETGFFRPVPLDDGSAAGVSLHGRRLRPLGDPPVAAQGRERHHLLREPGRSRSIRC